MNNEVYVVINTDNNEIVTASMSYTNIQEFLMDNYMEDIYYEFLWNINYHNMDAFTAYTEAKQMMLSYYRDFIIIEKVILN